MKKLFLSISLLAASGVIAFAQEKNVGIGTKTPEKSAVLDIHSTNQGVLIPRLSETQIKSIPNPAQGLLVFKTGEDSAGFYFYNGKEWKPLTDVNAVATLDANGWALDGNAVTTSTKTAADENSFIGVPADVPLQFKIGNTTVGKIQSTGTTIYLGANAGNPSTYIYGFSNIGIGSNSLANRTSTMDNVAIGRSTLGSVTGGTAIRNIAIGYDSFKSLLQGNDNVGIGGGAFLNSTSAYYNTGIGTVALRDNNGMYNIAIGYASIATNLGSSNVAIGSRAGLDKNGDRNVYIGNDAGRVGTLTSESDKLYVANSATLTPLVYGDFAAKFISIGDVPVDKRDAIAASGNYGLLVKKGILAERVRVALASSSNWADYVFEEEYKQNMMSLPEIEKFTLENKHLPNVPSAREMVENGLDVTETSKMFMEKIEELTLYLIEMNKKYETLQTEVTVLKSDKLKLISKK